MISWVHNTAYCISMHVAGGLTLLSGVNNDIIIVSSALMGS